MAITKTRRDLINAALANLGILAAGQTADAEDFDAVDEHVDSLIAWLEATEILDLEDVDQIPLEFFDSIATLLSDSAASEFGLAGVPATPQGGDPVQKAIDNIRLVTYARPTYERQKTEYF